MLARTRRLQRIARREGRHVLTITLLVSASALLALLPSPGLRSPLGVLAFAQATVLALTLLHG